MPKKVKHKHSKKKAVKNKGTTLSKYLDIHHEQYFKKKSALAAQKALHANHDPLYDSIVWAKAPMDEVLQQSKEEVIPNFKLTEYKIHKFSRCFARMMEVYDKAVESTLRERLEGRERLIRRLRGNSFG
jgi:hypothetical protein